MDLYSFSIRVQAINHGVVVNPPDTHQCTPEEVVRVRRRRTSLTIQMFVQLKHFEPTTPKAIAASTEVWTNKKATKFGASTTTPAAFQSGQHNRWLAAKMCGEHADTGQRGYKRIQLSQKNPVQPENALHSHEQRYSLTSDRIAPASPRKAKVPPQYTPGEYRRQATISRKPPHGPHSAIHRSDDPGMAARSSHQTFPIRHRAPFQSPCFVHFGPLPSRPIFISSALGKG